MVFSSDWSISQCHFSLILKVKKNSVFNLHFSVIATNLLDFCEASVLPFPVYVWSPKNLKFYLCSDPPKYYQLSSCSEANITFSFTSDNKPDGIENATHNTSVGRTGYLLPPCPGLRSSVLRVAFSIPPGSLSLVQYPEH
jgi:hypothetical protein